MTKSRQVTDYDKFEAKSTEHRRLLREEQLIVDITEALVEALETKGIAKSSLAKRLGKSRGFVSQILGGGRNLTLRTLASVADALGYLVQCRLVEAQPATAESIVPKRQEARTWAMVPDFPSAFEVMLKWDPDELEVGSFQRGEFVFPPGEFEHFKNFRERA